MSVHTIKNSRLSVSVRTLGAELISLRDASYEFIWQSNKDIWPRYAPVLFPVVGKLKNDAFSFNGSGYNLSQHGFARDREFTLIHESETSLEFELTANEETFRIYPFHFSLIIKYELKENLLTVSYKVLNPDNKDLLFSIGAHPGFNCKRKEGESLSDYKLIFDSPSPLKAEVLKDGLQSNTTYVVQNRSNGLDLNRSLFDNDAIVLKNKQVKTIQLVSSKTSPVIEMTCVDWPYFGIWAKKGSNDFVCLEPWHGIADSYLSSGILNEKEGIIALKSNDVFTSRYSIKVTGG